MSRTSSNASQLRAQIRERLGDEIGTLRSEGPEAVAMLYPSPYNAGMSSLGFQTIYREIHASGRVAERAFLPDDVEEWKCARLPLLTYETERPVSGLGEAPTMMTVGMAVSSSPIHGKTIAHSGWCEDLSVGHDDAATRGACQC